MDSFKEVFKTIDDNSKHLFDAGAASVPTYADGYKVGHKDGQTQGEAAGREEGRSEGYNAGHSDGYDLGYEQGEDSGREAGYAEGREAGYSEGRTAGYEEGNAAGYESGHSEGYAAGYEQGEAEGVEVGREAERSDLWDHIQDHGKRTNYASWFTGKAWDDVTFKPKYLIQLTNGRGIFDNSNIINAAYTDLLDFSKLGGAEMLFAGAQIAKLKVVDFRNLRCSDYNLYLVFNDKLKYIEEFYPPVIGNNDLTDLFTYSYYAFIHIKFCSEIIKSGVKLTNANLDKESLDSVVYWLSTTTKGLSVTLPLAAVNKQYETSEGANDGSTSPEWESKVAARPNWTIQYA